MEELNYTLLTLWGYPLSVLELVGVLTGFAAVLFASKAWAVNFLFGMVNAIAYFLLYYQYHLYSVMLLQLFYFSFSIYGYYHWKHPKAEEADQKKELRIGLLSWKSRIYWMVGILVIGMCWGLGRHPFSDAVSCLLCPAGLSLFGCSSDNGQYCRSILTFQKDLGELDPLDRDGQHQYGDVCLPGYGVHGFPVRNIHHHSIKSDYRMEKDI